MTSAEPQFLTSALVLRGWFSRQHAVHTELLLGCWKVGSGQASVTWPESVDEALCVGWMWWVVSAKQEAARERRLATPIEYSASGEGLPQLVKYR